MRLPRVVFAALLAIGCPSVVQGPAEPAATAAATPRPGEWASRQVAGTKAAVDSRGRRWAAARGLTGGTTMPAWGGISGSQSESLYRSTRVGARSWTVKVPRAASYAVDVLMADSYGTKAGQRVFDVTAADGRGKARVLASRVDVVRTAGGWRTHHVTGVVPVRSGTLVLRFVPRRGKPIVSGLQLQTYGPIAASRTTFSEGFGGAASAPPRASAWNRRVGPGPWGAGELQAYTGQASNVAQTGAGRLALTARREHYQDADGSQEYTSGRIDTKGKVTFTYGTVEARIKVPAGVGLWPAFWGIGANQDVVEWPRSGELDVMEWWGHQPATVVGSVHSYGDADDRLSWRGEPVADVSREYRHSEALSAGYHVYGMRVMPDVVTYTLDGLQYASITSADLRSGQDWPIGHPYYLILNLAVGGAGWPAPSADTPFPAAMLVDWVRIRS